jgi:hypothetical protein
MRAERERGRQCDLPGPGDLQRFSTVDITARKPKRKFGNVWLEGGRYLFRSGANGSTVFDTWKWFGAPAPKRGRA